MGVELESLKKVYLIKSRYSFEMIRINNGSVVEFNGSIIVMKYLIWFDTSKILFIELNYANVFFRFQQNNAVC